MAEWHLGKGWKVGREDFLYSLVSYSCHLHGAEGWRGVGCGVNQPETGKGVLSSNLP